MKNTAAVLTVSDKASRGERVDTSGPALCELLKKDGWDVLYTAIVPDETEKIQQALLHCADELRLALVLTTGGTGFSPRDVTPEATLPLIERETRGIPEAMRAESMKITPRGCLSRGVAGIRGRSLFVNLPGSEKAARENYLSVAPALRHGVDMLCSEGSADCGAPTGVIRAVCISEQRGQQKHPVDEIVLRPGHGIVGDAHAGAWHRQVSLLAVRSVQKVQEKVDFPLGSGAFAENVLIEGIVLHELPVGTRLKLGTALCEVTQIGKECHSDCAIRKAAGDCVMPREGIFVRVLTEGRAKAGDFVAVLR